MLKKNLEGYNVLKPLGDRVILEVEKEEEKTVGGIVLAGGAKEKPQTAKVVAVGTGRILDDGKKLKSVMLSFLTSTLVLKLNLKAKNI